jgi:DNA-binding NarL/FixJ family response regulator
MNQATKTTLLFADDHVLIREGFRTLIKEIPNVKLLADATNGEELFVLTKKLLPDVVITDIRMPVADGIETTKNIKARFPDIKVIALSSYEEYELIQEMRDAGASGYLNKDIDSRELSNAINAVKAGKSYYCSTALTVLSERIDHATEVPPPVPLTKRERELIPYIAKGMSNQEIAKLLHLSKRTVESHRWHLQEKLGLKTPVAIALYALKHGLITKKNSV